MKRRSVWELIVLALVVAATLGTLAGAYFVVALRSRSSCI